MSSDESSEEEVYITNPSTKKDRMKRRNRRRYGRLDALSAQFTDICVDLKMMFDDSRNELCTIFFNSVNIGDIAKFLRNYNSDFHSVLKF